MTSGRPHADIQELHTAFTRAQNLLTASKAVFLTTHERTDGDDLSVVLSLARELKAQGKQVVIGIKGGVPKSLQFLSGSEAVQETLPEGFSPDLIVLSGCSTKERTGLTDLLDPSIATINFDHHPDNSFFGTVNVVDPGASSVAELTYHFFKYTHWKIDAHIATCLLTGIITDTGSFLHSNTESSTLKAASELMRKGARSSLIAKHTFSSSDEATLRAWSKAIDNTWLDEHKRMICSVVTEEDLFEIGNPPPSVFERFVETINKVPEASFALFLKQDGNIIKGSLRSDPQKAEGGFDVGQLARLLGGGGHQFAAGFSLPGKLKKLTGPGRFTIEQLKHSATELILD